MIRFRACVCLAAVVLTGAARAQTLLELPFDLKWGDSPEKMISWARAHSLDLTITLPARGPDLRILRAGTMKDALPGGKARSLECHFLKGRLIEVTEHHAPGVLPGELFRARFEETKKQLIQKYGPLLANRQERAVEDDFVTKTRAFHREPVKGLMLLLVFTEVEDTLRQQTDMRFSILYRNDNYRKELASQD